MKQSRVNEWVRWYKIAQPSYRPHALTCVLRADGVQMLAAVLKALGLEQSLALVQEWEGDSSTAPSPLKDSRNISDKDSHTDDGGEEQG